MVKPRSDSGRFRTGTSTFTTRARRRALSRPTSVASVAMITTRVAVIGRMRPSGSVAGHSTTKSSATSLSSVNTNRDEKNPTRNRQPAETMSPHSRDFMLRTKKLSGAETNEATSRSEPATCAPRPMGRSGNSRHPT